MHQNRISGPRILLILLALFGVGVIYYSFSATQPFDNFEPTRSPCLKKPDTKATYQFHAGDGEKPPQLSVELTEMATDPSFWMATPDASSPCINHASNIIRSHRNLAVHESAIFRTVLKKRCKQLDAAGNPPLVVDIGANVGYFTLLSAAMGCRVAAFEPNPALCVHLNISIALNRFQDLVTLYPYGVSDKEGETSFSINCINQGESQVSRQKRDITIKTVPVDDILPNEKPILIKMDVEGFEDKALQGMPKLVKNAEHMLIETKFNVGDKAAKQKFVDDRLHDGWTIFSWQEKYEGTIEETLVIKNPVKVGNLAPVKPSSQPQHEDLWYIRNLPEFVASVESTVY